MALQSQAFRGDAKLEAAAVSNPAHIVPGARGDHVRKIQRALNRLENAGLDPDGVYGQGTADAVLAYKQKREIINRSYETQADNIVGLMTMAALDAEMAASEGSATGVPLVSRSPIGACDEQAPAEAKDGGGASDLQPADPVTVALISKLVVKVRLAITAARFQLTVAGPFVRTSEKLTPPTGPFQAPARQAINLLINVFSMDKHKNPRPGFETSGAFASMDVALNRSFGAPADCPVLFVPTHINPWRQTSRIRQRVGHSSRRRSSSGLGVPAGRSTFAMPSRNMRAGADSTLIHELAHFVGGQPLKISHDNGAQSEPHVNDRTVG